MPYNFAFSCETIIYTSVHQIQIGSLASNIKKKKKGGGGGWRHTNAASLHIY